MCKQEEWVGCRELVRVCKEGGRQSEVSVQCTSAVGRCGQRPGQGGRRGEGDAEGWVKTCWPVEGGCVILGERLGGGERVVTGWVGE